MREPPGCMNSIKQIEELRQWPMVAILVLNWNGWRDTIECIESLQRLNYPNYDIVVIDNGSIDGSMDKIKNWGVKSKLFAYNTHNEQVRFTSTTAAPPRRAAWRNWRPRSRAYPRVAG